MPVTLAPDPATLEHLDATGRGHTVSALATLSGSPARETLSQSFVPVDAGALVSGGLAGELGAQVRRGAQVLGSAGVGAHATDGEWVATSGLGQAAVDALAPRYQHLVVPPSTVSGSPGPLTAAQPFTLAPETPGRGAATTAMVSDTGLGSLLAAGKGSDGPLVAVQILAELSLVYYEAPNLLGPGGTPAPRGVVGVAPGAWAPDPAFVSSLLTGLQGNPVLLPVTLDQLFEQVPVGADRQPTTRHPLAPASPTLPVRALRTARAHQSALQSAEAAERGGERLGPGGRRPPPGRGVEPVDPPPAAGRPVGVPRRPSPANSGACRCAPTPSGSPPGPPAFPSRSCATRRTR